MLRTAVRILSFIIGGLAVLAIALYAWAYFALQPSKDEVASVVSPDGRFVARLIEINGGATTSFGYTVALAESGPLSKSQDVASLYGAVRNASAYGVNLRWVSSRELTVEYLDARSSDVLNAKPVVAGVELSVSLRPNINDATAPSGGMLYNIKGHGR